MADEIEHAASIVSDALAVQPSLAKRSEDCRAEVQRPTADWLSRATPHWKTASASRTPIWVLPPPRSRGQIWNIALPIGQNRMHFLLATSPDNHQQIQAVTDLLKVALQNSATAKDSTSLRPEAITAWASLIGSIAWPTIVLSAIVIFREPIASLLTRVESLKIMNQEVTLHALNQQVEASAVDAKQMTGLSRGPSEQERTRATTVATLAANAPADDLREVAKKLAREYENIRITHLPSDSRTHLMEIVVAKMRTIGTAVYPLRHEFMISPSPGERLIAVAAMQVTPDYESLTWLANRILAEKPFVGYHASVALYQAAKNEQAPAHKEELLAACDIAQKAIADLREDSDRTKTVGLLLETVKNISWIERGSRAAAY
jgi:hypothetical protein